MKRINFITTMALFVLLCPVLLCSAAFSAIGAGPNANPAADTLSQTAPTKAPIARHSPAQPKWGETLEVVYDPAAPKAAFASGDEVYAIYSALFPEEKQGWIKLEPRDGLLAGSIPVEKGAGYVSVYFITTESWDRNAHLGIMVYRADGKPARGANHQEMSEAFSPDSYMSFFEKERSLYPDNFAVYRDKWFFESNVKKGEFEAIVKRDLPVLEKAAARGESAELLFALSYGNLLLGREEAGRKLLARMVEAYPNDYYTMYAFSNYDYQAFSRQWKGQGPEEVRKLALDLIARIPEAGNARRLLERYVMDKELSLETAAAVCRAWIRDEPENPHPYYYFALAAKSKNGDTKEAEAMLCRGLTLLLRGNLRLYGDIGGTLTNMRIPAFFALRAELRRDSGNLSEALADIKAAESVTKETRPGNLVTEASIWSKLGFFGKAEACYIEAHSMGDKEAEAGLREIYARRHGGEEGFTEYLAAILEKPKAGGTAGGGAGAQGSSAVAAKASSSSSGRGGPAPDFAVTTLDGADLKLSDLKGKVVVLNFWFIGCAPCRVEMPGLNTLVEEFDGEDVVFVGFASDPAEELRKFLEGHPFNYRIVPEAGKIAALYGVSVYPTHILINKDGQIAYFLTGGSPERHDQLRPLIKNLLR